MNRIRTLLSDLAKGKHLELFLIVVVVAGILLIDFLGTDDVSQSVYDEVILAVLMLLAIGALSTRVLLTGLDQKIETFNADARSNQLLEVGITGASSGRPDAMLTESYKHASHRIRILSTALAGSDPLPTEIAAAVRNGVKVQILLAHPESETMQQRLNDLDYTDEAARSRGLKGALQAFIKRNKLNDFSNFEIRYFHTLPPFAIFAADEWMTIGFFWHTNSTTSGTHLIVSNTNSNFGKDALLTFEKIWERSEVMDT